MRLLSIKNAIAAVLTILFVFAWGCSHNLGEKIPPLESKLKKARNHGAKWCAPKEYSAAEAYLDFAKTEIERNNIADAQTYLNYADGYANTSMEKTANCKHDLDGDGVIDLLDGDPYRAEDYDGWQDADGIPDPDNDGDGFLDGEDACPDSAEDFDGHEDKDGCPDLDNDGDGIPDGVDKCKYKPEDIDGWHDEDGCPDLDNDFDGILDADDKCPDVAETKNNFLDDDGCPDIRPKIFKIIITPEIKFSGRSTRLYRKYREALAEFAEQLKANPELSLRIEAHLEKGSNPAGDKLITQKQAEVVAQVLIDAGIAPERLIQIGFGGERPQEGVEGRGNRRIMLIVFQTQ